MKQERTIKADVLRQINEAHGSIFKFVIAEAYDLDEVQDLIDLLDLREEKIVLMPAGDCREQLNDLAPMVAEMCKENNYYYGSRLQVDIWDEVTGIGGMNHFMLPATDKTIGNINWGQRGLVTDATRYGNYAMEHLINMILVHGGRRVNLRAKVFGGGKVLQQMSDVGQRNLTFALAYLKSENIKVESSDLGNIYPRKVIFEPATGRAFVKKLENLHNDTIAQRETDYRSSLDSEDIEGDVELF
jgi:chemotaxis protein CheD